MKTTYIVVKGVTGDTTQKPIVQKPYDAEVLALPDLIGFIDPARSFPNNVFDGYDYMADEVINKVGAVSKTTIGSQDAFSLGTDKFIQSVNSYLPKTMTIAWVMEMTSESTVPNRVMECSPFTSAGFLNAMTNGTQLVFYGQSAQIYGPVVALGTKLICLLSFDAVENKVYLEVNGTVSSGTISELGLTWKDNAVLNFGGYESSASPSHKTGQILIFDKNLHKAENATDLEKVKSYFNNLYS